MPDGHTADSGAASTLTRATVNLTPRTVRDLEALVATTGMNRTDLVNRAVRLLALLNEHLEVGTLAIRRPNGRYDRVFLL
jgi:hypothetical protein